MPERDVEDVPGAFLTCPFYPSFLSSRHFLCPSFPPPVSSPPLISFRYLLSSFPLTQVKLAGIDDFFPKPVKIKQLLKYLEGKYTTPC